MENKAQFWFYSMQWDNANEIIATLKQQVKVGYCKLRWSNGFGLSVQYDDGSVLSTTKKCEIFTGV